MLLSKTKKHFEQAGGAVINSDGRCRCRVEEGRNRGGKNRWGKNRWGKNRWGKNRSRGRRSPEPFDVPVDVAGY